MIVPEEVIPPVYANTTFPPKKVKLPTLSSVNLVLDDVCRIRDVLAVVPTVIVPMLVVKYELAPSCLKRSPAAGPISTYVEVVEMVPLAVTAPLVATVNPLNTPAAVLLPILTACKLPPADP
jgi:hypothetical protein